MDGPIVSVVVCTANRADDLRFMLKSFSKLIVPTACSVELIVVDNGSTDDTKKVVEEAIGDLPMDLKYIYEPSVGLSNARNAGLSVARGDIIAWTDDDCIVSVDWITKIVEHFLDQSLYMIGGRVELYNVNDLPIATKTSPYREEMSLGTYPSALIFGCNMAFRKKLASIIGNFDVRLGAGAPLRAGEDTDFVYRAHKANLRVVYFPDIVVWHNHHRSTPESVIRVRRGYALSDGAFLAKHILAGDTVTLRWMYWRVVRQIQRIAGRPLSMQTSLEEATLLIDMMRGAFTLTALELKSRVRPPRWVTPDPELRSRGETQGERTCLLPPQPGAPGRIRSKVVGGQPKSPVGPSISVIIPAYNAVQTLERAVRSVLDQTSPPTEIIVVDDGSTDGTRAVALAMPSTKVLSHANTGPGEARNAGARAAVGDWLAFLDADDEWHPEKLEKQILRVDNPLIGVVNCRAKTKAGQPMTCSISPSDLWMRNDVITSSTLVRRQAFEAVGGFSRQHHCEDYDLWLRLASEGWLIVNCPQDLVVYSPAAGSLSQQAERLADAEVACIEAYARRSGVPRSRLNERIVAAYLGHARGAIHTRDRQLARRLARKSLARGISISQLWMFMVATMPTPLLDLRRRLLQGMKIRLHGPELS